LRDSFVICVRTSPTLSGISDESVAFANPQRRPGTVLNVQLGKFWHLNVQLRKGFCGSSYLGVG